MSSSFFPTYVERADNRQFAWRTDGYRATGGFYLVFRHQGLVLMHLFVSRRIIMA